MNKKILITILTFFLISPLVANKKPTGFLLGIYGGYANPLGFMKDSLKPTPGFGGTVLYYTKWN